MARSPHFRRGTISAAVAAALLLPSISAARDDTIALQGTDAPGLPSGVVIFQPNPPVINNAGQAVFFTSLSGTGIGSTNDGVIYRDDTLIVRKGDPAPGLGAGITTSAIFGDFAMNAAGQVAFHSTVAGTGVTTDNNEVLNFGSSLIAREGNQAPGMPTGVVFSFFQSTMLNDAGQVAYGATVSGTGINSLNNDAIYRNAALVAREGNQAPGLPTGVTYGFLSLGGINNGGTIVYESGLAGTGVDVTNNNALWRNSSLIARSGDGAPSLPGVSFAGFGTPQINNAGQTSFFANLTGTGVDTTNNSSLWRDSTLIARTGNQAPGLPSGVTLSSLGSMQLNDAGQLVYVATLGGTADGTNNQALYRNSTLIARKGNQAPGLAAGITFGAVTLPVLNNTGQVAFFGNLAGAGITSSNDGSLWIGDGVENIMVAREGMTRAGRTIGVFFSPQAGQLNDSGQFAYQVVFNDSTQGSFLFTPELHWRQNFSGGWDSSNNWTVGLAPGAVHDVRIDPAISVTVTGPASDRSVRTLEVGGGNGIATLSLAGGKITTLADQLTIRANGVLTGDGTIGGPVLNQGTVRAQNVTINGGLTNEGLVTGNGRINGDIYNTTGRVSVGSAESLRAYTITNFGTGRTEVIGGQLETLAFANNGQIILRNALVHFGSLANPGQLLVSFGTSDVFGSIDNWAGTGKIIVSNGAQASFYDPILNNGEFRVSAGGAANLFGLVNGGGNFTGTGDVRFEGGLSPGNSPALITMSTATTFSASSPITMELAGLTPGSGHDKIIFNGPVTLLGGDLDVVWFGGWSGSAGDHYDLFDWNGTLTGRFGHVLLPTLAIGLTWDIAGLYTTGEIGILGPVPEPETYAMLMAGLGLLGFAARRRRALASRG